MIPKVNNRGHSFKGVMAYLMHDKNSETANRVAWYETGNMIANDPEKAALVMAWTDQNADLLKRDAGGSLAGKLTEAGAVYHYSLSWAHGEQPDQEHQRNEALKTLELLGLKDHEYVLVAHNDTEHVHVHIVANLTNSDTGKRHTPSFDKRELQQYALEYEREHGLHCHVREENAAKRERGEHIKHQNQKQDYSEKITRAYYASDNGKSFIHALQAEGLQLAKARRGQGFVIVDEKGDIQKLARQLDIEEKGKAKTAAINAKFADIDREKLEDADRLSRQIREQDSEQFRVFDRDAQETQWQIELEEAAHKAGEEKARLQVREEKQAAEERRVKEALKRLRAKEATDRERTEKFARYQKYIDEKVAVSRQQWQIDELTRARDKAKAEYSVVNTFFGRVFQRRKVYQAYDHLQDMEKRLEERRSRWLADIEAFNKKRPEWIKERERQKYGFGKTGSLRGKTDQDRQRTDFDSSRNEKENAILREAESSPELAARLKNSLVARNNAQKKRVSRVKAKAQEYENKKQAEEQQTELKKDDNSFYKEKADILRTRFGDVSQEHEEKHNEKSIAKERLRERYERIMQDRENAHNDNLTDMTDMPERDIER